MQGRRQGGQGRSQGRRGGGGGLGRMGGLGAGGSCVCPACGARVPHQTGAPCVQISCPKCGSKMTRAV